MVRSGVLSRVQLRGLTWSHMLCAQTEAKEYVLTLYYRG